MGGSSHRAFSRVCSTSMLVERCAAPGEEWDDYVEGRPGAHLGHAAAWSRVLHSAYGLSPHYLVCRTESGAVEGVLPLVSFRTLAGRRELVSIPFHDVAGVLASNEAAASALRDASLALARELGCSALELRQAEPGAEGGEDATRVNLVLPLESDEETQWRAVRAKVRNQVRKAEREGLELASWPAEQLLDGFYQPFCVNMRDLGSPAHARAFFRAAASEFGDRLRFVVAADGARSVGGLVAIRYASRVTVTWASTLRSERRRCPNNLIYWEAIRWAVSLGASEFDFGRSPVGGGTYRFKRGWGAEERPLAWARLAPTGERLPLAPPGDNPTLARLSSLWTRLPLGLTSRLGPRIRRFLSS